MRISLLSGVLCLLLCAACGGGGGGNVCAGPTDCSADEACVDGVCVSRPVSDSGVDSTVMDAGDAAVDACAVSCGSTCCGGDERCTGEGVCAVDLGPCADDSECLDDSYCHETRCTPYGTPPRGDFNAECRREVQPGRFLPTVQCHWDGPAADDPAATFREVESTPLVIDFGIGRGSDEPIRPSIVFISTASFTYGDGGIVRVIDGRTCTD